MSYRYSTSLPAYKEALEGLGDKQKAVLEAVKTLCRTKPFNRCNDRQIAAFLGWDINRVTPRRGELVEKGLLVDEGAFQSHDGPKKVHYWKVKAAPVKAEQTDLFNENKAA